MSRGEQTLERALARAALAGDEAAWQALYDAAFDGLFAYAQWRCAGLRAVAEDVVQETWLTAVRRLGDFNADQGSFLTWLRGVAANVARNHFRKEHRRAARPLADAAGIPAGDDPKARDRAERIAETLACLPDRYEAVLRGKYLDQLSVEEIARDWKETPKAVESLLTRAGQAFRDAYREDEDHAIREGLP